MHLFPNETPLKLQQRDLSDNTQTQEESEVAELKGGVTGGRWESEKPWNP